MFGHVFNVVDDDDADADAADDDDDALKDETGVVDERTL